MTLITKIEVRVRTGSRKWAGTDGHVYLGITGREFYLDTEDDNFEEGHEDRFVLGDGTNVLDGDRNDPRYPWPRHIEDLAKYPVYIRLDDHEDRLHRSHRYSDIKEGPAWLLDEVTVTVHPGPVIYEALTQLEGSLWLGTKFGMICYLEETRSYG
jgi:hypothetical protein